MSAVLLVRYHCFARHNTRQWVCVVPPKNPTLVAKIYCMRSFLVVLVMGCGITAAAQTVKTIPGVLKENGRWVDTRSSKGVHFSVSQKTLAMKPAWNTLVVIDPLKGSNTTIGDMTDISPDHRYAFRNSTYTDTATKETLPMIITKGIYSDTAARLIKMPWVAMGWDERNNLVVTKLVTDQHKMVRRIGLYRVDRVTGKELETLRTDTLCISWNGSDGCAKAEMLLEKNYLLLCKERTAAEINILPFGKPGLITVHEVYNKKQSTDSSIFYVWIYKDKGFQLKGYEVNTGKFVGQKIYPWATTGQLHKFFFTQGKIYFYNPDEGKLYEDEPAGDTMRTTRTWDMRSLLNLPANQEWDFAVAPGPSFLFYPIWMDKAEAGGAAANTASMFNAAADKTTLKIAPFYNRTTDEAAIAEALKKASDERFAALQKAEAAKDPCKIGWNVPGYKQGIARMYSGVRYILQSFDCEKDLYTVVQPPDLTKNIYENPYRTSIQFGSVFRESSTLSDKQYHTCNACDGDGSTLVTRYTTKTKDLPWGYFSGIETKSIRTTATTSKQTCKVCNGFGILLK